ncbi:ankyrin repeat domain-containing protein [Actinomadura verrucosospora]|uniref:Ankyrin repeat domain protein n=1 Tax=Actinomadura verrucosospora TaxID=46165 RepID=A0A7D3ZNW7_ACTVE|nr:ankyrin repeat domain-containing protein [Actinomadura verrucosospora]QKG22982.1 ankyrin repeat domain protein [Actinomadura verrucosospora]
MTNIAGATDASGGAGLATGSDDVSRADALRTAAYLGDLAVLKEQIAAGADVNAADERGWTALLVAAREAFRDGVEALLAAGADPGIALPGGFTALHQVIQHTKDRPVKYEVTVVRDGVETVLTGRDEIRAETGSHPDDEYEDCVDVARMLIDGGIDVEMATSEAGQTPLSHAASRGTAEITELLIATKQVDLDSRDKDGVSPLHYAARHGHADPVRLLLEAGANPNITENYGFTPLHEAAENGHAEVVRALLTAGADPECGLAKPFESYPVNATPLDIARLRGHQTVVDLLDRRD